MTPHEETMFEEIQELQMRLSKAERSRLKWKCFTVALAGLSGFLTYQIFLKFLN